VMGADENSIIKTQNETHSKAAIVTMSLLAPLRTLGVRGNESLNGLANKLKRLFMDVKGNVIGEDITSDNNKKLERSSWMNFRKDAKNGLQEWLKWIMDCERFSKLSFDCTKITCVKADGTVSDTPTNLVAGDVMSALGLDAAYDRAKNGYVDGAGKRHPKMKPHKVEAGSVKGVKTDIEIFVMFVGGASAQNLSNDPLFEQKRLGLSDVDREKLPFAGGIGLYDQKIVVVDKGTWNEEDAGIVTSDTADWIDINGQTIGNFAQYAGAAGIATEVNLMLGAGAGVQPFQAIPDYEEDGKTIDSGRKLRIFADLFFGFEKFRPKGKTADEIALSWHDEDYGVQAVVATIK